MKHLFNWKNLTLLFLTTSLPAARPAEDEIILQRFGPAPIAISLTGFSSEATAILKTDLTFMGFTNVPPDQAQFLVQGRNGGGRVEGRVIEQSTKNTVLAKAFTGGNERYLLHSLSDAMSEGMTGRPFLFPSSFSFPHSVVMNPSILSLAFSSFARLLR